MRMVQALLMFSLLCVAFATFVPMGFCQGEPYDILVELLSNPRTLLIFLVQFGLGLGLGYFSVKALKYIIAIVSLVALGIVLNVWQFGGLENFLARLGLSGEPTELIAMLNTVVALLGILTMLPIGVGFLVGAITAAVK